MAALDRETFDLWRETDAIFKMEIREHLRMQHSLNLDMEGRISKVETVQHDYDKTVSKRTTWLSAVVSAIVGALVSAGAVAYGSGLR